MRKMEIVYEQQRLIVDLDIYQVQIVSLYNELLANGNILAFIQTMGASGFMTYIEKNGDSWHLKINKAFLEKLLKEDWFLDNDVDKYLQWYIINFCRKMLTHWHTHCPVQNQRTYEQFGMILDRKQRGILTKILKLNKKRMQSRAAATN